MDDTQSFDDRLKSLDKKLEELSDHNKRSKLHHQITMLEQELKTLKHEEEMPMTSIKKTSSCFDKEHEAQRSPPWLSPVHGDHGDRYDRKVQFGEMPGVLPLSSTPMEHKDKISGTRIFDRTSSSGAKVRPATFDGTGSWLDYKAHFQACAELGGLTEDEMGLYLAVSLRGQAQGVLGNLGPNKHSYLDLTRALESRFAPPNQTELHRVQLKERRQRATETLSGLGQDIRRLANLAYPTAPCDVRETLAKEQFIDALLSSDMRLRVRQARPVNLNDAVRHAVELKAYVKADSRVNESKGYLRCASDHDTRTSDTYHSEISKLQNTIEGLSSVLKEFISSQSSVSKQSNASNFQFRKWDGKDRRRCYICYSEDHLKRNCPQRQNQGQQDNDDRKYQTQQVSSVGSGLYVQCMINSVKTYCLIDTGSTVSLISKRACSSLLEKSLVSLKNFKTKLYTASGDEINVSGKFSVLIRIADVDCIVQFIVADIDNDVILGLDFFLKYNCKLDMTERSLTVEGKVCYMSIFQNSGTRITGNETQYDSEKKKLGDVDHEVNDDICNQNHKRMKPDWMKGYVSSIFREKMVNTKTTKRKSVICPVCREDVCGEPYTEHVIKCTEARLSDDCGISFKKKQYLLKHQKRCGHGQKADCELGEASKAIKDKKKRKVDTSDCGDIFTKSLENPQSDDVDKSDDDMCSVNSDWDHNPDVQVDSGIVDEVSLGRIFRKPTKPQPVKAPAKSKNTLMMSSTDGCVKEPDPRSKSTSHKGVQTEFDERNSAEVHSEKDKKKKPFVLAQLRSRIIWTAKNTLVDTVCLLQTMVKKS